MKAIAKPMLTSALIPATIAASQKPEGIVRSLTELSFFLFVNKLGHLSFRDNKTVSEFLPHQTFGYVKMSYFA